MSWCSRPPATTGTSTRRRGAYAPSDRRSGGRAVPGRLLAEVHDRRDRATTVRALVRCGDGDEYRGIPGHRRGDAADAGLDLPVPVHVGVVEHGVAPAVDRPVLAHFALEEDVDQPALEVRGPRPVGQVETRVHDGLPD